jgi:type I restriction enzyme R subunit
MFLTGFDSKPLNTLYVDKNLRYHRLIQAYSRTNRVLNKKKSHGNIISFRNLKMATDDAIALFSNKEANDIILMRPYEDYIGQFSEALVTLLNITPTVSSVDDLESEVDEEQFVKAFRELMRLKNSLGCYADFSFNDLEISEQDFEDYKSKYLDIYDKVRNDNAKDKESILNDVDFEIELVHRDEITLYYILSLIKQLVKIDSKVYAKKRKAITNLLSGDVNLRSKKELIEKFIDDRLSNLEDGEEIEEAFQSYWGEEKLKAFNKLCEKENLDKSKIQSVIDEYLFANQIISFNEQIDKALLVRETFLKRRKTVDRIKEKVLTFIETYVEGIAA